MTSNWAALFNINFIKITRVNNENSFGTGSGEYQSKNI